MTGIDNKPVLAMYDVRGKQEFIFRTNRIQEIVGASWRIRDLFKDYLFDVAAEISSENKGKGKGIYSYKLNDADNAGKDKFTPESFEEHLKEGYLGEVVYEGGGNFILLFKDADTFRKVTYEFTKSLLENIGT